MKYRQLSRTGVFVSELCLGSMTFGGKGLYEVIGTIGQDEANMLVGHSLDAGVNFFDTANVYSNGESERILGKALGRHRKDVILATKVRSRMGHGPNDVGLSRVHIMQQVEGSLRRLGTDYIDLYQIHNFDSLAAVEETLRTLDDLVRSGKVRYIGCSNLSAWQIMKFLGISELRGLERFVSVQSFYSLAARGIEREIVPLVKDQDLALLTWSPLAGGYLSGKFTRQGATDPKSRRTTFDFPPINKERAFDIIDRMMEIAKEHDVSVAQIALSWLLHQGHVTSIIIGVRNAYHLRENLRSIDVSLSEDELSSLNEISALSSEYPGWIFSTPSDRLPVDL
ncbi:MAG: aldo/keto reductase [Anaerolineae bacterium]|nr:aldo/keto reductase [Anaerolineae bacterium]